MSKFKILSITFELILLILIMLLTSLRLTFLPQSKRMVGLYGTMSVGDGQALVVDEALPSLVRRSAV